MADQAATVLTNSECFEQGHRKPQERKFVSVNSYYLCCLWMEDFADFFGDKPCVE